MTFPRSTPPISAVAQLLTEWEQRTQPIPSEAYQLARARFLTQLQLLNRLILPTASVNVDEEDIRNVLNNSPSIRIGSGRAGGSERATRSVRIAVEDTQQNLLGPLPTTPATIALLYIASCSDAGLELNELNSITQHIQQVFGENLEVVFGHDTEPALAGQLEVCLLLGYGLPVRSAPVVRAQPTIPPEEVFPAAVRLITEHQLVGSSLLQRHLGTGYNRTCQLLEELEAAGIIWRKADGGYGVVSIQENALTMISDGKSFTLRFKPMHPKLSSWPARNRLENIFSFMKSL